MMSPDEIRKIVEFQPNTLYSLLQVNSHFHDSLANNKVLIHNMKKHFSEIWYDEIQHLLKKLFHPNFRSIYNKTFGNAPPVPFDHTFPVYFESLVVVDSSISENYWNNSTITSCLKLGWVINGTPCHDVIKSSLLSTILQNPVQLKALNKIVEIGDNKYSKCGNDEMILDIIDNIKYIQKSLPPLLYPQSQPPALPQLQAQPYPPPPGGPPQLYDKWLDLKPKDVDKELQDIEDRHKARMKEIDDRHRARMKEIDEKKYDFGYNQWDAYIVFFCAALLFAKYIFKLNIPIYYEGLIIGSMVGITFADILSKFFK